jgi:hypothetical protein
MNKNQFPRSRQIGGRPFWVEKEVDDYLLNAPRRPLKCDPKQPVKRTRRKAG